MKDREAWKMVLNDRRGVCSHICVLACYYLHARCMQWLYLALASVALNFRPRQAYRSALHIKKHIKIERKRAIAWLRPHGVLNFDL